MCVCRQDAPMRCGYMWTVISDDAMAVMQYLAMYGF